MNAVDGWTGNRLGFWGRVKYDDVAGLRLITDLPPSLVSPSFSVRPTNELDLDSSLSNLICRFVVPHSPSFSPI